MLLDLHLRPLVQFDVLKINIVNGLLNSKLIGVGGNAQYGL